MTTPTREQALTPVELRELCAQLSEDGQAMLHRAVHAAHISGLELGRDQGLREAKEVCEAMSARVVKSNTSRGRTNSAAVFSSGLLDDCAAAIEQLRGE